MVKIKYHLAEDTIDLEDRKALAKWLLSEPEPRLTMGPLTRQFEESWSKWLGRKYSVFVNSGSSANLLMASTLITSKRLRNGRVIVPSVGWGTLTLKFLVQLNSERLR